MIFKVVEQEKRVEEKLVIIRRNEANVMKKDGKEAKDSQE